MTAAATRAHKDQLRERALRVLNGDTTENAVRLLINAAIEAANPNDVYGLSDRQIDNVFKAIERCDVACAYGRGHQSIAICTIRGQHGTRHYSRSRNFEWDESRLSDKTVEQYGNTYRLAFSDEGWW